MQYDNGKYLTEHKTQKVMSSRPLGSGEERKQSAMELASKQGKSKPKVTKRYSGNDSVFMGC